MAQPPRLRIPFSRILVQLRKGRRLSTNLIVFVVDSTRRTPASKKQSSHTSGQPRVAPIRSRRPSTRMPRRRTAGAWPGWTAPAPSSRALITRARISRSGPQDRARSRLSVAGSPSRRSTQSPRGKASHSWRSGSFRSSGNATPTIVAKPAVTWLTRREGGSARQRAADSGREEVAEADHAADRVVLHDGEVAEAVKQHDLGRFFDGGVGAGRLRVGGHPVRDLCGRQVG